MVACLQGKNALCSPAKSFSIGVWSLRAARKVGREMKNGMQARRDESQIASLPSATWNALHFNSLYFIALSDIENLNGIHFCIVYGLQIVFDVTKGVGNGGVLLHTIKLFILIQTFFFIQSFYFHSKFFIFIQSFLFSFEIFYFQQKKLLFSTQNNDFESHGHLPHCTTPFEIFKQKLLQKLVRLESIFFVPLGNERKIPDTYQ